jgi:hypothetical protein
MAEEREKVVVDKTEVNHNERSGPSTGLIVIIVLAVLIVLFLLFGGFNMFSGGAGSGGGGNVAPASSTGQ